MTLPPSTLPPAHARRVGALAPAAAAAAATPLPGVRDLRLIWRVCWAALLVLALCASSCYHDTSYTPAPTETGVPLSHQYMNPDVITSVDGSPSGQLRAPMINGTVGGDLLVPLLQRQADCSLTEFWVDPSQSWMAEASAPHIDQALHRAAGLPAMANAFAHGCQDSISGVGGRNFAAVGRAVNGNYYAAGVSQSNNPVLVVYRSSGSSGPISQTSIPLTTADGSNTLGLLAIGDLNGDGTPDLAVTISNSFTSGGAASQLAILLGDGSGGFAAPVYLSLPLGGAHGLTLNDFRGSGHLDIAVSGQISNGTQTNNWLVVLPGNGNGTFGAAITGPSGIGGANLVSADLDNDGQVDIVSGDGHILLGQGNGSFSVVADQTVDSFASSIAVADFNGDGHADLALIGPNGSYVNGATASIWNGSGNGHFSRQARGYALIFSGFPPPPLAVADLDGDGHPDLVVGGVGVGVIGPQTNTLGMTQFLLGRGDGSFASPAAYAGASGVLGDFNGDGKPDLLGFGAAALQPWLGNGAGGFQRGPLSPQTFSPVATGYVASIAADLDGDQKLDVVYVASSGAGGSTIHVRHGNGDGSFQGTGADIAVGFGLPAANGGHSLLAAALTASGHSDLVLLGRDPDTLVGGVYLLAGDGNGGFAAPRMIDGGLSTPYSVVAADLNGDGHPDLVVSDNGQPYGFPAQPGSLRVYLNHGDGSFATALVLGGASYPAGLAIADVNHDGTLDVVVNNTATDADNDTLVTFPGNGNGSFAAAVSSDLPGPGFGALVLGDLDGNGKPGALTSQCCGTTFTYYAPGNGDGSFASASALPLGLSNTGSALADLNGDGRPDVLLLRANEADVFLTPGDRIFCTGFELGAGRCTQPPL